MHFTLPPVGLHRTGVERVEEFLAMVLKSRMKCQIDGKVRVRYRFRFGIWEYLNYDDEAIYEATKFG